MNNSHISQNGVSPTVIMSSKNRFGISPQPHAQAAHTSINSHPLNAQIPQQQQRQIPSSSSSNLNQNSSFTKYFSGTQQNQAAISQQQQQQYFLQQPTSPLPQPPNILNQPPQISAFTIKILEGRLALANSNDLRPFVQVQFNKRIWRTSINKGSYPKWLESKRFEVIQYEMNQITKGSSSPQQGMIKNQMQLNDTSIDGVLEIIVLHKSEYEEIELGRTQLNVLEDDMREEWVCIQSNNGFLGSVQVQIQFEYTNNFQSQSGQTTKTNPQSQARSQLKQNQINLPASRDQGKTVHSIGSTNQSIGAYSSSRNSSTASEINLIPGVNSQQRSSDIQHFYQNLIHEREILLDKQRNIQYRAEVAASENIQITKDFNKLESLNSNLKTLESQVNSKRSIFDDKKQSFLVINSRLENQKKCIGELIEDNNKQVEEEKQNLLRTSKLKRQLEAIRSQVPQLSEEFEDTTKDFHISLQKLKSFKLKMMNELSQINSFFSSKNVQNKHRPFKNNPILKSSTSFLAFGVDSVTDFSVSLKNINQKIDYLTEVIFLKNAEIESLRDQIDTIQSHFDEA